MHTNCPNCGAAGMDVFYEARRVPAHSCLMMDSRQEARAYPRRDLSLGFCRACGFISNVLHDESVKDYGQRYEEQQSFSPRFRAFQTDLIGRLIERYDIRGKNVLEIGCGKGDFLIELCRAGGNRGVGVDPAVIPQRLGGQAEDIRWIVDYYSEKHADIACDVVCCRHTLEHVHQTREFVRMVRRTIGDRLDTVVFFEVPDVHRVLADQAFWDIYYEHCSYFSLGSLAGLFRACRFDVVQIEKDFDGQYLLLVARPTEEPTQPSLPQEDDLGELTRAVGVFRVQARRQIEAWRQRLQEARRSGQRVAIWGSGSKCVAFWSALGLEQPADAVVDVNPHRHGRFLAGLGCEVASPETLRRLQPHVVLVMNPIYRQEIADQLRELGVQAQVVPV